MDPETAKDLEFYQDDKDDFSQEARSRAQACFLIAVRRVTPEPLFSLRDDVFPKYRAALDVEKKHGLANDKLFDLMREALELISLRSSGGVLRTVAARSLAHPSSELMKEASHCLIAWSKRFNLTGTHATVRKQCEDPAFLEDAYLRAWQRTLWLTIAAMETIWVWYSSTKGRRKMRANPPEWRDLLPLSGFAGDLEFLPEIRLIEQRDHGPKGPPSNSSEMRLIGWYPWLERERKFRQRIEKAFRRWVLAYISSQREAAHPFRLGKATKKRGPQHFEWVAYYQVEGRSATEIVDVCRAEKLHVGATTVADGIKNTLLLLDLEKRQGRRGPKPKPRI